MKTGHGFVAFPSQFTMSENWSFCSPSHEGHITFVALRNMFFLKKWMCSCLLFCNDLLKYPVQRLGVLDTLSTHFFQINNPLMPLTWSVGPVRVWALMEERSLWRTREDWKIWGTSVLEPLILCWYSILLLGCFSISSLRGSFHNRYGKDSHLACLQFS